MITEKIAIKRCKYDYFLFLLITSLAFGAIGGALQIPRLLTILFFPYFINRIGLVGKYLRTLSITIVCFMLYCLLSLAWTPNLEEGLTDFVYFILHFLLFMEIVVFAMCANNPKDTISKGWLVAVFLTIVFAMWEFHTGIHMPYCRNSDDTLANLGDGLVIEREFAAVAFVNYNTYVTFLCFAIPFLLYIISNKEKEKKIIYWFTLAIIILAVFCILKNGSRGGLLSVFTVTGIYFLMKPKNLKWTITILLLFALVIYVFYSYGDEFVYIIARASDGNLTEGGERLVVWDYALDQFFSTVGFGVGIGGMFDAMEGVASDIKITHNIFLEILLLYGFVFCIVFVAFLLKMLFEARQIKDFPTKVTIYTALISFPIYGIINSGYLSNPFVFVGLASLSFFSIYSNTIVSTSTK